MKSMFWSLVSMLVIVGCSGLTEEPVAPVVEDAASYVVADHELEVIWPDIFAKDSADDLPSHEIVRSMADQAVQHLQAGTLRYSSFFEACGGGLGLITMWNESVPGDPDWEYDRRFVDRPTSSKCNRISESVELIRKREAAIHYALDNPSLCWDIAHFEYGNGDQYFFKYDPASPRQVLIHDMMVPVYE